MNVADRICYEAWEVVSQEKGIGHRKEETEANEEREEEKRNDRCKTLT